MSFAGELEAHGGCGVQYGMSIVPPLFLPMLPQSLLDFFTAHLGARTSMQNRVDETFLQIVARS
jgi:hypothetical protein